MPRILDPDLQAAMDSGSFTPYFNLQLMDSDGSSVIFQTQDIIEFRIDGLEAYVVFHDPDYIDDFTTFRIRRGAVVLNPVFVQTSNFWPFEDRRKNEIRTLRGHLFPADYFSTAGDVTYEEAIDTVCAQFGFTAVHQNPLAAWLSYQFLPDGRSLTLNTAKSFFTILRQKYLVFATDYGEDQIYFFQAHLTQPSVYTVSSNDISVPGHGAIKTRTFISRDETDSTHTSGGANAPIHNLGFLPSTASHPVRYQSFETKEWIIKNIAPNLKYLDFDRITLSIDAGTAITIWPIKFREIFNPDLTPAWQWQAKPLDIFGNTEGGALPSTIEAAAPYTPLDTSGFSGFLTSAVNNLQAFATWVDDFAMSAARLISGGTIREKLTAARTYYVRTDGSDSNTGLANTSGGAFLTVQKAVDVISGTLDMSIYDVTIQAADGTYSGNIVLKSCVGAGAVIIQGNAGTPANVVFTCSSGDLFSAAKVNTVYKLRDMKVTGTGTAGSAFVSANGSYMEIQNVELGTGFVNFHYRMADVGAITVTGNYTISGGCNSHVSVQVGAFRLQNKTVTLTGTPTPTFTQFLQCSRSGSTILINGNTFSGSANGARYDVALLGAIDPGVVSETYLPGNALGRMRSGGRYGDIATSSRTAAQFDKTNTTLANITGLTATLLAGRTYKGRLILYTTSNVAGGVNVDFDGGTATATTFIAEAMLLQAGALVAPGTARSTALATDIANVTAITVATIIIEFVITVNAAGTLIPRFACNAAVGTSSVLVGSNMMIEDITP